MATTYYVTKSGNDANNGLTQATAFLTINKGLSTIIAGDTLKIGTGTYKEIGLFYQNQIGSSSLVTTIQTLGDGPVTIDAGLPITSAWTLVSGNIYKATITPSNDGGGNPVAPRAVVVDDKPIWPDRAPFDFVAQPTQADRWTYNAGTKEVSLWLSAGDSPANHAIGIIGGYVSSTLHGLNLNNVTWVVLNSLTILHGEHSGLRIDGDNITIQSCIVKHSGRGGAGVDPFNLTGTNVLFQDTQVYDCSLANWPEGASGSGWDWGFGSNGGPSTTVRRCTAWYNHGEGINIFSTNSVVENCIAYDNWSANIYMIGCNTFRVSGNLSYDHAADLTRLTNNAFPQNNNNKKFLLAIGILTGDEISTGANLQNGKIYNNIVLGCRRGYNDGPGVANSALKSIRIWFNTIVLPNIASGPDGDTIYGVYIPWTSGLNTASEIRNNIILGTNAATTLLNNDTDPAGIVDPFLGLEIDTNVFQHFGRTDYIHQGPTGASTYDMTHATWVAVSSTADPDHGTGDVLADPLLIDYTTLIDVDKKLKDGSPAAKAGVAIAGITTDYGQFSRAAVPSIGAWESAQAPYTLWYVRR